MQDDGFRYLFERMFTGGGGGAHGQAHGGGGYQFVFNGMPFGQGGYHHGYQHSHFGGEHNEEDTEAYALKALKSFGLPSDAKLREVKKKYYALAKK
jgi:hypothetical protein